jgi:transposase
MQNATTIPFGLPGVAVDHVERISGGHGGAGRLVHIVTTVSSAAGCPQCGVISTSVKQYRTTRPRDLPYGVTAGCDGGIVPIRDRLKE